MRIKITKTIIVRGKTVKEGEVLSVPEDIEETAAKELLYRGVAAEENEKDAAEKKELEDMSVKELTQEAKELGIDTKGLTKKQDLIDAIMGYEG